MRVPDEGLAVSGSMEEAWREIPGMPPGSTSDPVPGLGSSSFLLDPYIIGVCHSRESGVEFDPEALISLGLCKVLNPLPMGTVLEDFLAGGEDVGMGVMDWGGPSEAGLGGGENIDGSEKRRELGLKLRLTPVGRAVMEMCWVGGLALMSFGPS